MLAGVRMSFGPNDDDEFFATRDLLLERFERWLVDEGGVAAAAAAAIAGEASLALDWKRGYGGGELGRWQVGDVADFLLDWCPRKLSVSAFDAASIPASLALFVSFLDGQGLMAPGSAPFDVLAGAAMSMIDDFVAAMGDPSNFGMAKSLFGGAEAAGVDLGDPDAMQAWMDEFNARPEEERRRFIPGPVPAPPKRALPPVALPDDAEVAASKAAAPILAKFAAFAAFVGTGRKLTQTGRLTLADARALVEELGTGDVVDEVIGDQTYKLKSSDDLTGLRQIFAWARKAGVVRVAHGRVIATKRGLAIARDPGAFFDRSLDALLDIGPLASQRHTGGWFAWPEVDELLDTLAVELLVGPYAAQGAVPVEDFVQVATSVVLDGFEFPAMQHDRVGRRITNDISDMLRILELAGVVRCDGGSVELTPAGTAAVNHKLAAAGYEAPAAGRFAEATATELLLGTDLADFPALLGEVEAWRRRRDPAQAAAELAVAVRELDDPALRNLALALMAETGAEVSGPELRKLADDAEIRGVALCWLVDQGLESPDVLFDPDDLFWFVDVLAYRLVTLGVEGLIDTLGVAGSHAEEIKVIDGIWRSPSTATDTVLAAIGDEHPSKIVAKAARKAVFKRRSWLASRE